MILGNNDGTKIDSAVFFSKLKMANRSKKIINVRANLTTQIYQASVGEVCREEGRPLPSCNPFMPVWLSCSHYFAVYGSFATSTPTYSAPSYMHITGARLVGRNVIVSVLYIERPVLMRWVK
jgi:hypothetical protein